MRAAVDRLPAPSHTFRSLLLAFALAACALPAQAGTTIVMLPEPPGPDGPLLEVTAQGADIRDVLRLLAKAGHVRAEYGDDVRPRRIDLTLTKVSWIQAVDVICRNHDLAFVREGDVLRVTKPKSIPPDAAAERQARNAADAASAPVTVQRTLAWSDGAEALAIVRRSLSPTGEATLESGTLVITDKAGAAGEALSKLSAVEPTDVTPVRARQPLQLVAVTCRPSAENLTKIRALLGPAQGRATSGARIDPYLLVKGTKEELRDLLVQPGAGLDAIAMTVGFDEQVDLDFSVVRGWEEPATAPVLTAAPRHDGNKAVVTVRSRLASDATGASRATWMAPAEQVQVLIVDPPSTGGSARVIALALRGSRPEDAEAPPPATVHIHD